MFQVKKNGKSSNLIETFWKQKIKGLKQDIQHQLRLPMSEGNESYSFNKTCII
jgi:hypothetical protein